MDKSAGAAEIIETSDPFEVSNYKYNEVSNYKYNYDECNNLTGYSSTTCEIGTYGNWVTAEKIGNSEVQYILFEKTSYKREKSRIEQDANKILNARIDKVVNTFDLSDGSSSRGDSAFYKYDLFGRITEKRNHSSFDSGIDLTTTHNYVLGTGLINTLGIAYKNINYNFEYTYDACGRITKCITKKGNDVINTSEYEYSRGNLYAEKRNGNYISKENITFRRNSSTGYCTYYKGTSLSWVRGGMLKGFKNVEYEYDSVGQRFKKTEGSKVTLYSYDGKKLLSEDVIGAGKVNGSKCIKQGRVYIYDNEGIVGFYNTDYVKNNNPLTNVFYFIKDALGNVVSIVNGYGQECARYTYDAWGRCTVYTPNGEVDDNQDSIGNTNPIRWKSQYYDVESGLYYVDGRYYSAEKREYLDPLSPEEMFAQATNPMVDAFKLTLSNPLEVGFVSYTADSFQEMSYDPEEMTDWEYFWKIRWAPWHNFWNSTGGKILSVTLFIISIIITAGASLNCMGLGALAMFGKWFGMAGAFFLATASYAGWQSSINGGSYWEGFSTYITNDWSETLAITSATYIAAMAIRLACSPKCFKAGTLVQTEEGLKPIEDIQVGDKVLAYDEETGVQAYKKVVQLFRNISQDWTSVTVNGEEIISTPKHKYYLPESKSWKSAEELKVGTKVLLTDGSYGIIEAVKAIHYDEPETTYNFEVEDFHTYYVGTGVLVHNKGCGVDLYRGGNDMTLKKGEYAIKDGLVVPGKDGVSVNLNPAEVARFGTPYKIVNVPEGLTIAQKGLNPAHYVIRPTYAMPLNQYQSLLYQVKLIPYI